MKVERTMIERGGKQDATSSGHDGYCQFEYSGRRCPMPGNSQDMGRWLCRHHIDYANRGNDMEQQRFFARFDNQTRHGVECIQDQIGDWYDTNMDRPDDPAWYRQDGESKTDYNRRMFALCKKLSVGIVQKTKEAGGSA